MTADVPVEVGWVHVTLPRLVAIVVDAPEDADAYPDGVPVSGTVTFTPNLTPGTVVMTSSGVGVIPQAKSFPLVDGSLDAYLVHPGDPDLNPSGWTYGVVVNVTGSGPVAPTSLPGVLDVPAGVTEVDLLPLLPLSSASGGTVTLTPGPAGPAGEGVPLGGLTGQTPVKASDADLDTAWADPGAASVPDATSTTKGKLQLAGDLAGTAAAPTVPGLAGKADTGHTHPASDVSDSTATGRAVLTAADAATARGAIGAGTSSLALGTTAGTAKAGDYAPGWTDVTGKPATFPPSAHTHGPDDLGSGTPAAGQYLDGDGTWKDLPDGGAAASGQFPVNTANIAGATTVPATHAAHRLTMTADAQLSFDAPAAGHAFVLWLAGAFVPTLPASVVWAGGSAPAYASAGTLYHFTTLDAGTTWLGSGQAYS